VKLYMFSAARVISVWNFGISHWVLAPNYRGGERGLVYVYIYIDIRYFFSYSVRAT